MFDLLVRNGKVVTSFGFFEADVGVENGVITAVGRSLEGSAERVIDARGKLVIPGGIDAHTHFQMPYKDTYTADDFYTGTVAAACGGITTVIDFATPRPGEPLIETWKKRVEEAKGKVAIDYGLHVVVNGLDENREREMGELVKRHGVSSFKIFTAYRERGLAMNDGQILDFLQLAGRLGALVGVHGENDDIVNHLLKKFLREGKRSPLYHALSRPPIAEAEAIQRVALLAQHANASIYIVHLSSKLGLDAVRDARRKGVKIFAETCPHYLVYTSEVYEREDAFKFILSPPIKGREDREALWKGLENGLIMTVGSDHAVFPLVEKLRGRDDFTRVPGGVQGTENIVPILYSEGVVKDRISLERFVQLVSLNPARFFGLYPRKGVIQVGSDADLTIIDPDKRVVLGKDVLHSAIDHSIYEGFEVKGYPTTVISRGEVIVEDMEPYAKPGRGLYLHRKAFKDP